MYSTITGSETNSRIDCPTISLYNWIGPVEWFKNCKPLQGPRYYMQGTYLLIDSATTEDVGDYTCKFMHNENGTSYSVTATRSFTIQDEKGFSFSPEIIAPPQNETKDVEIGRAANITCSACFGKGTQLLAAVLWLVNGSKVGNWSEARIWEEQEQNFSSSNQLSCLSAVLRIARVRDEDLRLRYECLALNFRGLRKHTLRLRRRKPIDHQSTYYVVAGFVILLMLISTMMIMLKVFWIEFVLLWRDIARPHKARNDGKTYDAYVIYPRNHKDSPEMISSVEYFVHQILPDVLENKCGYNLCIYGRDMLPGEDVATAVETNIRKSRRHIFVLTPQAVHSEELAYEQEVALHSALIHNDSKAILIEMEALSEPGPLQFSGLPGSLQHLVQVQGTIRWREDHVADKRALNSRFWKRVRYHMPAPSTLPRETSGPAASTAHGQ
ncbi:interleukin-1 receptor-like 1 isoform X2 [Molossus molossus]|nr:interleukin-1 receptor-like 1 isoform X2 [Molossus molossus]